MGIIRTFVSYSRADRSRVEAVLRRAAPYGVKAWIDERNLRGHAGLSLSESIREAISDPTCPSLSLFLSAASVKSGWVEGEVGEALARLPAGRRIIPIALDPLPTLDLPPSFERALRKRGATMDTIHLDAAHDAFIEDYALAVLQAGGAHRAESVVLYLGHRDPNSEPVLPAPWQHRPALELRLDPVGHANASPTLEEWAEIRAGLAFLRRQLRSVQTLHITGRSPLGVAVIVGRAWDRGTHVRIEGWDARNDVIWTSRTVAVDDWSPGTNRLLAGRILGDLRRDATRVTLAILAMAAHEPVTEAWNATRAPVPPLVFVRSPVQIRTAEEAAAVIGEALGVFAWIRTACPHVKEVDLVLGLPFALAAIFAHHLRHVGTVHFHDQVLPAGDEYRLAITWP